MKKRILIPALAGILTVVFVVLAIFAPHADVNAKETPQSEVTTEAPQSGPQDDDTIGVENPNGKLEAMSVVGKDNEAALNTADTTSDSRTPATVSGAFREQAGCELWVSTWSDLVDCMGNQQWYIDALNARSNNTGFTWDDVLKWAKDPQLNGKTQLVIHVFGTEVTDKEAREIAHEVVANNVDVNVLPIVRHDVGFANTRATGHHKVGDFYDKRQMVRVSLAPVSYNADGTVKGLRSDAGVFVDCFNIWWEVVRTWTCEDTTCTPPPPPVTPKPEPTPTPTPTPKLDEKQISDAPQRQGNLPEQQMPNQLPAQPKYEQPTKPADPPATYVPPAPPTPAPPAPTPTQPVVPTPDPAPAPAPEPEAPTPDAPETGCTPIPGVVDCN